MSINPTQLHLNIGEGTPLTEQEMRQVEAIANETSQSFTPDGEHVRQSLRNAKSVIEDNPDSWNHLIETRSTQVTPQISEFVSSYFSRSVLDPSYQVPKTRWTIAKKRGFISAVIRGGGMSGNPIHLSRIRSGNFDMIQHYEKELRLGKLYTTVDGHNRGTTLKEFLNNELRITHPHLGVNKLFKELPASFQEHFRSLTIKVEMHEAKTLTALSQLFIDLNDGIDLNAQEKRNAKQGDPAKTVRKVSTALSDKMSIFEWKGRTKKLAENDRREMDLFMAEWLCRLNMSGVEEKQEKTHVNAAKLDDLYDSIVPKEVYKAFSNDIRVMESLFSSAQANKNVDTDKISSLTKTRIANCLIAIRTVRERGHSISLDGLSAFFNWFLDSEELRLGERPSDADVRKQCAHIKDDFQRVKAMNEMKDDIYKEWSGSALANSAKFNKRKEFIERDLDAVFAQWLNEGVIS
tara:strand:+ start:149 stop:1537 length:1389 start_codon:yes stop_codon:yes gene_type:complete